MSRRNLWLVAGREIREALRRRTFWIIVGVLLAGSTAAVVLPEVIGGGRTSYEVVVVGATPQLDRQLRQLGEQLDADVVLTRATSAAEANRLVADEEVDVAVVAGDQPAVIARQGQADAFVATAQQVVGIGALAARLEAAGLDQEQVAAALRESTARVVRLDEDAASRQGTAALVAAGLYLLLILQMMAVANGTAIEKANRISEVLLAIVRPGALLFGKVLGVAVVGLATTVLALLPVVVRALAGGGLPAGLGDALIGGSPWFLLGVVLYLTVAGALGALVERQEEAGSVVMPLTLLLVVGLLVGQSAAASPLGRILAIIPFTSPMVMPSRLALGEATPSEVVLSLLLGVGAVLLTLRVGAGVYARAIVRTGRRLKLRDVLAG